MKTKYIILALLGVLTMSASSGCSKNSSLDSDEASFISFPETGKLGRPNILADGFTEAKLYENGGLKEYSISAILPAGNSSLKIVIKPAKLPEYFCTGHDDFHSGFCGARFSDWHELCPVCGGKNTLKIVFNPSVALYQGSNVNWLIDLNVDGQFTFTVWKSGKPADAVITLFGDFIIEYYENGATDPTKVKEIKVVD